MLSCIQQLTSLSCLFTELEDTRRCMVQPPVQSTMTSRATEEPCLSEIRRLQWMETPQSFWMTSSISSTINSGDVAIFTQHFNEIIKVQHWYLRNRKGYYYYKYQTSPNTDLVICRPVTTRWATTSNSEFEVNSAVSYWDCILRKYRENIVRKIQSEKYNHKI